MEIKDIHLSDYEKVVRVTDKKTGLRAFLDEVGD